MNDTLNSVGAQPIDTSDDANIFSRAVLLKVEFARLGNRRKVNSSVVNVDTDKSMLHVSKTLLQSEKLDAIKKHDAEVRKYISSRAVPSNFRSGVHLYPITMVVETNAWLTEQSNVREGLVTEFLNSYQDAVNSARERLGDLFNPTDYKEASWVSRQFAFSYTWIEAGPANQLRRLSVEMFEQERAKFEQEMKDALDEARTMLREGFAQLVEHMAERLSPGEDGKRKVFRDSLVSNMREFLDVFDARNLSDDGELKAQVERARELLSGVDAGDLRGDATMRARIEQGLNRIKGDLSEMTVDAPVRRLVLDDEPAAEADPLEVL